MFTVDVKKQCDNNNSAHTFASTPSRISGRRNESKWLDRVSNLGPLALKSDTELDVICLVSILAKCFILRANRFANISENFISHYADIY